MNSINQLAATAGQVLSESYYGAFWRWKGHDLPCTHTEIIRNPPLMIGGYSPNTEVTVMVRKSLFEADWGFPKKGDPCLLTPMGTADEVSLQVQSIIMSTGDLLVRFVCNDGKQGA